ncbi:MAG TPA: aromatic amino acid ammonia-lyase, partial [Thermoanaerobaculia bacterium]|nr:aromatic amino acid ammonia-lyase [Thermoanaerobaculia bacterium]
MTIRLDGHSLTIEQLADIARNGARVECDPSTRKRVSRGEALIAQVVENYRRAWEAGKAVPSDYGITTGFGEFKDKPIAPDDLVQLQRNLLLSHSVGVGENCDADDLANYFPAEVVRGALATRLNAFLKGHSGVRAKLVEVVEAMLNRGVIPLVPLRGSVGASGDLCPLSHLFATLLGEGRFYTLDDRTLRDARELPQLLGFDAEEIKPQFKEGLALVNGANFSAAMLALAAYDAKRLADTADAAASLTLEAMAGCTRALDEKVHHERGHAGQIASAERMRAMIAGSRLVERSGAVQDAYSLRCAPQVHGATRDTIRFVRG